MNNKFCIPLPDILCKNIRTRYINKEDIILFCISTIMAFAAFFPFITEWLGNPDAIWNSMVYKSADEYEWEISLGRYGLSLIGKLKQYLILPAYSMFFSIVFLGFICVLIRKLFSIKKVGEMIFLSIFVILTPTIISTLTYYYCSDAYFFSYFLAILSITLLSKKKDIVSLIVAVLCLFFSLSIYQAYICVSMILALIYIVMWLLSEPFSIKTFNKLCSRYIVGFISAVVLYISSSRIVQWITGNSANGSRGFSEMGKIPIKQLPEMIIYAYWKFYSYFLNNKLINNDWADRKTWNVICGFLTILI